MATFGQIKQRVSGRLLDPNNTAVTSSDVALSINDAIRYWKSTEFFFNNEVATLNMTSQSGTIPLPSDFFIPATKTNAFCVEYSEQRYILRKVSKIEYNALWMGNGFGIPQVYSRIGGSYECYPLPDRNYTTKIYYLKDYPDLVNDSDTNDFTDNAERLITLWATANLISEFRQDEKMESYFRNAAINETEQLLKVTADENSSGSLVIWS
jgi:hypothetical protein